MALTHTNRLKQQLVADLERATELADRLTIYRLTIDLLKGQRSSRKKPSGKAGKAEKPPEKPPSVLEAELFERLANAK